MDGMTITRRGAVLLTVGAVAAAVAACTKRGNDDECTPGYRKPWWSRNCRRQWRSIREGGNRTETNT